MAGAQLRVLTCGDWHIRTNYEGMYVLSPLCQHHPHRRHRTAIAPTHVQIDLSQIRTPRSPRIAVHAVIAHADRNPAAARNAGPMTGIAALEAQEGERLSCRGEKLLTVRYAPPGETKAVLVWHHGYGEHVGRYKWGASPKNCSLGYNRQATGCDTLLCVVCLVRCIRLAGPLSGSAHWVHAGRPFNQEFDHACKSELAHAYMSNQTQNAQSHEL